MFRFQPWEFCPKLPIHTVLILSFLHLFSVVPSFVGFIPCTCAVIRSFVEHGISYRPHYERCCWYYYVVPHLLCVGRSYCCHLTRHGRWEILIREGEGASRGHKFLKILGFVGMCGGKVHRIPLIYLSIQWGGGFQLKDVIEWRFIALLLKG